MEESPDLFVEANEHIYDNKKSTSLKRKKRKTTKLDSKTVIAVVFENTAWMCDEQTQMCASTTGHLVFANEVLYAGAAELQMSMQSRTLRKIVLL